MRLRWWFDIWYLKKYHEMIWYEIWDEGWRFWYDIEISKNSLRSWDKIEMGSFDMRCLVIYHIITIISSQTVSLPSTRILNLGKKEEEEIYLDTEEVLIEVIDDMAACLSGGGWMYQLLLQRWATLCEPYELSHFRDSGVCWYQPLRRLHGVKPALRRRAVTGRPFPNPYNGRKCILCDGSTPDKQRQHIKLCHTSNMGKQGLKPHHTNVYKDRLSPR